MIKAGVFGWPIIGSIMRGAGQIPVYRGTADASESLRDAVDALARGECIVIYPEGTTTKDPTNWPMQGKTGVARLVLLSPDTPVIPIGQWGAHKRRGQPIGPRIFKRRVAEVSAGEPVDLSAYRGLPQSAENLRTITDVIMTKIRDEVATLRGEPAPVEFFKPARTYVDRS
jgi:1-acyl-sn-glycerol-3-phosphate acyltransferase